MSCGSLNYYCFTWHSVGRNNLRVGIFYFGKIVSSFQFESCFFSIPPIFSFWETYSVFLSFSFYPLCLNFFHILFYLSVLDQQFPSVLLCTISILYSTIDIEASKRTTENLYFNSNLFLFQSLLTMKDIVKKCVSWE